MNTELERRKQEITRTQGRRKLWQRIVSALAAVVMFVTTYVLILPVEAQNRTFCEMEAHEHSAENGCYVETKTLKCEEKHEHTDECYITLLTLICQHEEHIHNKECYADKTADVETQQDWEASIKAAKLTGEWSEDILAIANTQLGYRESERNYILGENNEIKGYTRYGDWIGDKYTDWSAAFVAFCINYTGISKDEMTYDKAPEQWAELMKSAKLFNETITETNPGDIVFIDSDGDNKADRVGIVVENTEGKIKTVEGDLNNAVAYFEYELSAQTARTDVDSSVEESNSKDFAEAKSTLGRTGREASQTPFIIGSVFLPKNPNYNPPIAITDPENPDATSEPGSRVQNTEEPSAAHDNKGNTRAGDIPVLINPTNSIALINETSGALSYYGTLQAAMNAIASGTDEYTIVFASDYTTSIADWDAVASKGGNAEKINFTSTYNNGTTDIRSLLTLMNGVTNIGSSKADIYLNTTTEFKNISMKPVAVSGGTATRYFYARGNDLTFGEGVIFEYSEVTGVAAVAGSVFSNSNDVLNNKLTFLSGTGYTICLDSFDASSYTVSGHVDVFVGGSTQATRILFKSGDRSIASGGLSWHVELDGSEGANVKRILIGKANSEVNGAHVVTRIPDNASFDIKIKNMKGIRCVDSWNSTTSRNIGKLTIEGEVQIESALFLQGNQDVELLPGAVLTMGSNADGTALGNSPTAKDYGGRVRVDGDFIMGDGSKFIFAGTEEFGRNNSDKEYALDWAYRSRVNDLFVGKNCELLVYKAGNASSPLHVFENFTHDAPLKVGLYKEPNASTEDAKFGDWLLVFHREDQADLANHVADASITGVGKEICKRRPVVNPDANTLGVNQQRVGVICIAPDTLPTLTQAESGVTVRLFNYNADANNNGFVDRSTNPPTSYFGFYQSNGRMIGAGIDGPSPLIHAQTENKYDIVNYALGGVFGNKLVNGYPVLARMRGNPSIGCLLGEGGSGVTEHPLTNTPFILDTNTGYYIYNSDSNTLDYNASEQRFEMRDYTDRADNSDTMGSVFPFDEWDGRSMYDWVNNDTSSPICNLWQPTTDYWYSMTFEFEFRMSADGTFMGNDMLFEFMGDDDAAVYIDDVLVMDLTSIHSAWRGDVNFKTGEVGELVGTSSERVATLRQRFDAAGKTPNGGWAANGQTFEPGTVHRLKFFYFERCNFMSHCLIKFALPIEVPGTASVTKIVEQPKSDFMKQRDYGFILQHEDGSAAVNYSYTVTDANDASYSFNGVTDAQGRFTLKDGQTATIRYTPDDMGQFFYIEEEADEHTETTSCTLDGVPCAANMFSDVFKVSNVGGTHAVIFRNTPKLVDLSVMKQTSGAVNPNRFFGFTVTVSGITPAYEPATLPVGCSSEGNGVFTFNIRNGGTMTLPDIPVGAMVNVTENDYSSEYIDTTYAINGTPLQGSFNIFSDTTVLTTNNLEVVELTLEEVVVGGNDVFPFEITIKAGNNIYSPPASSIKVYDENGDEVTDGFHIDGGRIIIDSPTLAGLGNGYTVVVSNIPKGMTAEIEQTDQKNYDLEISGATPDVSNPAKSTVLLDGDKTVTYTNTRVTADLTITKTVVGGGTGPFGFTVTFTDGTGAAVNIPQPAANSGYTVANNVASFDLNKDGSVTITGIPVGTIATIVETSHNGYTVQYNFSDGTPSVSGDTAEVTIADDLTVTCINNAGFELPHTGGGGTLILTFSGAILMATALTYGMAVRRRRERREFTY